MLGYAECEIAKAVWLFCSNDQWVQILSKIQVRAANIINAYKILFFQHIGRVLLSGFGMTAVQNGLQVLLKCFNLIFFNES